MVEVMLCRTVWADWNASWRGLSAEPYQVEHFGIQWTVAEAAAMGVRTGSLPMEMCCAMLRIAEGLEDECGPEVQQIRLVGEECEEGFRLHIHRDSDTDSDTLEAEQLEAAEGAGG